MTLRSIIAFVFVATATSTNLIHENSSPPFTHSEMITTSIPTFENIRNNAGEIDLSPSQHDLDYLNRNENQDIHHISTLYLDNIEEFSSLCDYMDDQCDQKVPELPQKECDIDQNRQVRVVNHIEQDTDSDDIEIIECDFSHRDTTCNDNHYYTNRYEENRNGDEKNQVNGQNHLVENMISNHHNDNSNPDINFTQVNDLDNDSDELVFVDEHDTEDNTMTTMFLPLPFPPLLPPPPAPCGLRGFRGGCGGGCGIGGCGGGGGCGMGGCGGVSADAAVAADASTTMINNGPSRRRTITNTIVEEENMGSSIVNSNARVAGAGSMGMRGMGMGPMGMGAMGYPGYGW